MTYQPELPWSGGTAPHTNRRPRRRPVGKRPRDARPAADAASRPRPIVVAGPDDDWRLDDRTRQAGRRGLQAARAALARAAARAEEGGPGGPSVGHPSAADAA